jgi:pyruvate formate lyase activating enzyme
MATLKDVLASRTREGELYQHLDNGWVHCYACGHNCRIPESALGVCKVRFNEGGRLMVPWGYAGGVQCDPIEKKPFFHVHPGALAYSFGMLGCDLHCGYCQNWVTSQALRDPHAVAPPLDAAPAQLVQDAVRRGAWIDVYKVDLKSFDDRRYRELGGRLQPILDTIQRLHDMGVWLELVTLLIPGFNDGDDELKRLTEFVAGVSSDIPWHVTAFHGDYKMTDPPSTTPAMLKRAAAIGAEAGLRYVYAGNAPGKVGGLENTCCPHCHELLVERSGYLIRGYNLTPTGACPSCGTAIPGRWSDMFTEQRTAFPIALRRGIER